MSAIEEALNVLERSGGEPGDVERARQELEAIRRMAAEWVNSDHGELSEESTALLERLSSGFVAMVDPKRAGP